MGALADGLEYAWHCAGTLSGVRGEYGGIQGLFRGPAAGLALVGCASVSVTGAARMNPISAAPAITLTQSLGGAAPISARKADFTQALNKALEQVSAQQNEAGDLAQRFQLGDTGVSLEKTMVALQTANISFQALVQVRNRVVSAYQDIMNMQV
jgi:flagellar hook-basal body complex protein FliE